MEYQILDSNGVENTAIDGAIMNHLAVGRKSGRVGGIAQNCSLARTSSNSFSLLTGLIIHNGFRIKITAPFDFSFESLPEVETTYYLYGRLAIDQDTKDAEFSLWLDETGATKNDNILSDGYGESDINIARIVMSPKGVNSYSALLGLL